MKLRIKQALIVLVGTMLAVAMLLLGLWQMRVFEDQGNQTAVERAKQSAGALLDHVATDGTVGDVYGKQVDASGRYLPEQQLLVVDPAGSVRVLSAFQLADGRVLPIVRGRLPLASSTLPEPPGGDLVQSGIFLPSEAGAEQPVAPGTLGTVRLPLLAQQWPQQLLPGFVTLTDAQAAAQQLTPAPVVLPEGDGSLRNSGYAVQWWVFAAFALGMSFKVAHSVGRGERSPAAVRP
ncbi:MAG: SURF1 family protein [Micropruina sp.]|nr:SURF1 family protein [Micropruina sp.]